MFKKKTTATSPTDKCLTPAFRPKQGATDPSDNCHPCKEDSCVTIVTTQEVYDGKLAERLTELEQEVAELTFLDLNDTPNAYTGQGGKAVIVNSTEDGLEFGDAGSGAGLELWDEDKTYATASAVLYEEPAGYFTIYIAKQPNAGSNPTTSTADWGIANDGAFVPINGNASVKDTKSFENIQVEQQLNFTGVETGVGIHYIVDSVNNILRLNRYPSSTPLDIDNDIIRYFSALQEIAIRWKLKLESVAIGDNGDDVLLIGTDGEIKSIPFSQVNNKTVIEGTDTDCEDFGSYGRLDVSPYLSTTTPFLASYTTDKTYYINQDMLQDGYLYGFPKPSENSFDYTITYL